MRDIQPVETPTDPYDPCWCQSGKKWKWCHKGRDKMPRITFGQIQNLMLKEKQSGECLHPNASAASCSGPAIKSHTVQKRGGLAAIAGAGHVISAKTAALNIAKNEGDFVPAKVGVQTASTFPGFCSKHDTEMFRPVETGDATLTEESVFLLTYRAVAYELATKDATIRSIVHQKTMDQGHDFQRQAFVQSYLSAFEDGNKLGFADAKRWKAQYDQMFLTSDYANFRSFAVLFDRVLPITGAGAFMPEVNFNGEKLQILGSSTSTMEHVAFNLTTLGDKTVATFGWIAGASGAATSFVNSFATIPKEQMANAVATLAFEHLENIFFQPSWWEGLDPATQAAAISRMQSGLPSSELRSNKTLAELDEQFIEANVLQILDGRTKR